MYSATPLLRLGIRVAVFTFFEISPAGEFQANAEEGLSPPETIFRHAFSFTGSSDFPNSPANGASLCLEIILSSWPMKDGYLLTLKTLTRHGLPARRFFRGRFLRPEVTFFLFSPSFVSYNPPETPLVRLLGVDACYSRCGPTFITCLLTFYIFPDKL